MKSYQILILLCLLFQLISARTELDSDSSATNEDTNRITAADPDPLFGCIYTCTRTGTATDASSICSATHVTVNLEVGIKSERSARARCRDPNSSVYRSATRFCTGGSRRCNPPAPEDTVVVLTRTLTDADRRAVLGYSS